MSELQLKSSLTMDEIENNFKDIDFFFWDYGELAGSPCIHKRESSGRYFYEEEIPADDQCYRY